MGKLNALERAKRDGLEASVVSAYEWNCSSASRPAPYRVSHNAKGEWRCTCMNEFFMDINRVNGRKVGDCKHIALVKKQNGVL